MLGLENSTPATDWQSNMEKESKDSGTRSGKKRVEVPWLWSLCHLVGRVARGRFWELQNE